MKTKTSLLVMALMFVVGATTPTASPDAFHFGLSKSEPTADAAVTSPEEVRLWFTQVPQDNSVRVRLLDGRGKPLETAAASPDEEDGKLFRLPLEDALATGTYTVSWRGIGDDGHVVTGDFAFSVTAQ